MCGSYYDSGFRYGTELLPHRLLSLLDCLKQIRDSKKANVLVLEKSFASFLSMLTNDRNKEISALSEHILKLQVRSQAY